jgi:hypothetical protein
MSATSVTIDSPAAHSATPVRSLSRSTRARCAGLALLAALVCAGTGCSNEAVIWVDNGGDEPMVLTIDGQKSLTVAPGTYERFNCAPGQHRFHVQAGGDVLFDEVKTIEEPKVVGCGRKYVFNPDNRNRYRTYEVQYGENMFEGLFDTSEEEPEPENREAAIRQAYQEACQAPELLPPDPWFEIAGVDHVFTPEPEFVVTRSGSQKLQVLTRVDPADYEFIAQARQKGNATEDELVALIQVVMRVLNTGNE